MFKLKAGGVPQRRRGNSSAVCSTDLRARGAGGRPGSGEMRGVGGREPMHPTEGQMGPPQPCGGPVWGTRMRLASGWPACLWDAGPVPPRGGKRHNRGRTDDTPGNQTQPPGVLGAERRKFSKAKNVVIPLKIGRVHVAGSRKACLQPRSLVGQDRSFHQQPTLQGARLPALVSREPGPGKKLSAEGSVTAWGHHPVTG